MRILSNLCAIFAVLNVACVVLNLVIFAATGSTGNLIVVPLNAVAAFVCWTAYQNARELY